MDNGYAYPVDDLASLLIMRHFPERTDKQTAVLHAFLALHGPEFDKFTFAYRVGQGLAPDPAHLPAVQAQTVRGTQKKIDLLAYSGQKVTIIEAKDRIGPDCLGQVLTYRHLYLEDHPESEDPDLVVVGRTSDEDTLRALRAHGVTVYLYETLVAQ